MQTCERCTSLFKRPHDSSLLLTHSSSKHPLPRSSPNQDSTSTLVAEAARADHEAKTRYDRVSFYPILVFFAEPQELTSFSFTGDIVHVKCGGSPELTHVHRSLLQKSSSPLEDLDSCAGTFYPDTNTLDISDFAQHDAFRLVVHWLYTGEIILPKEDSAIATLLQAYHAVYELQIDWDEQRQCSLSNATMDYLVDCFIHPERYGAAITVATLLAVPKGLNGPPIHFISDWLVRGNLTPDVRPEQFIYHLDRPLSTRLLLVFFRGRPEGDDTPPWEKDPCAYHLHFDGSARCRARAPTTRLLIGDGITMQPTRAN